MAYKATGILRQPYLAKLMLAQSETFRSVVGAADSGHAKRSIALFEAEEREGEPDRILPPRGIVMFADDWERIAAGTALAYSPRGSLAVVLEFPLPTNYDKLGIATREDECNWFVSTIGQIMTEIETMVNARQAIDGDNPLHIRSWRILEGPDRETFEEQPATDPEAEANVRRPPQRPVWFVTLNWSL